MVRGGRERGPKKIVLSSDYDMEFLKWAQKQAPFFRRSPGDGQATLVGRRPGEWEESGARHTNGGTKAGPA